MDNVVFRFSANGAVASLISDVVSTIGTLDSPVYTGFCTCGFDVRLKDWLYRNPHARSCQYPDSFCTCGQWVELDRWREGQGHTRSCKKSVANLTVDGVGMFLEPDGKIFTNVDLGWREWREWANRAITKVEQAA